MRRLMSLFCRNYERNPITLEEMSKIAEHDLRIKFSIAQNSLFLSKDKS